MDNWPTNNFPDNEWNLNAADFVAHVAKYPGFWCCDHDLKYLNLRIDTRVDRFLLLDRDKNRLSPDRVLEAINKWCNRTSVKGGDDA